MSRRLCSYCNLNVSFLGPIGLLRQLDAEAQSQETLVYTGAFLLGIGVNSYWAQGLKPPPTFMIMGLAYMTSPPTFVT